MPTPEPTSAIPFERFKDVHLKHPGFEPAAWFFAVDDGRLVGLSGLQFNETRPEIAGVDFTGVCPSHRRRGICRLLKVAALESAKTRGITTICTDNEGNNPMLTLNLELGFEPRSTKRFYTGPAHASTETEP